MCNSKQSETISSDCLIIYKPLAFGAGMKENFPTVGNTAVTLALAFGISGDSWEPNT